MPATVIYEAHPAMFRARPFLFSLFVLLIAACGYLLFACSVVPNYRSFA